VNRWTEGRRWDSDVWARECGRCLPGRTERGVDLEEVSEDGVCVGRICCGWIRVCFASASSVESFLVNPS